MAFMRPPYGVNSVRWLRLLMRKNPKPRWMPNIRVNIKKIILNNLLNFKVPPTNRLRADADPVRADDCINRQSLRQ